MSSVLLTGRLYERAAELQRLSGFVDALESAGGRLVLLSGVAGVGKSSLLTAFAGAVGEQVTLHWGFCDAMATPRPLGPFRDLAMGLGMPAMDSDDGELASAFFSRFLARVQSLDQPLILIVEDIHWADQGSLDMLRFLARRIPFFPVLLVASFRDNEVEKEHPLNLLLGDLSQPAVERLQLQPLSRKAVFEIAGESGFDADKLYELTGGNPFFVTELLASGSESGIPATVRDATITRLLRLSEQEREFLEHLSLIPGSVDIDLMRLLFGEVTDQRVETCIARGLIIYEPGGALLFRHELARIATCEQIGTARQRSLYRRILDAWVDADNRTLSIDRLAFLAARSADPRRVLALAPKAARVAATTGLHKDAAKHYATALAYLPHTDSETAASLLESWAYEAALAEEIREEVFAAREAAISIWQELGRDDKIGENLRWQSRQYWYQGESDKAEQLLDTAIDVLESAEPCAERAMAYSLKSQMHMLNNRMKEAIVWGKRALALAEEFGNTEALVHALNNIGCALLFFGRDEGRQHLQRSLDLAIRHKMHEHAARVYTNYSEILVNHREFTLADHWINEGVAFDSKHELDAWTYYLVGKQALLRLEQGRLLDAEQIATGVLALPRQTLLMRQPALMALAVTETRLGRPDALRTLDMALTNAKAINELPYIVPVLLGYVEYGWYHEDQQFAAEKLDELLAFDLSLISRWARGDISLWAQRCGYTPPAACLEDLPEPYRAEMALQGQQACELWLNLGLPVQAAVALVTSTGQPLTETDHQRAVDLLLPTRAVAVIDRLQRLAPTTGARGRRGRTRRGPYLSARTHPLGLTKKEQTVLALLARGLSNQAIADTLCRSPRTIESHVLSVLRKLNVQNRMEAAVRVQNEPWLLPKGKTSVGAAGLIGAEDRESAGY